MPLSLAEHAISWEVFRGLGRVPPLLVEFSERAGGDVAVLPKPLILNPAGTEGQILINARGSRNVTESISWRQSTRAIGRHIGHKPFGGLPPNFVHDNGRYHSQTVIEDLEGCPETLFEEVGRISTGKRATGVCHTGCKECGREMILGAGRMTATARADIGARYSSQTVKGGSEVCVQTSDDVRRSRRRSRLGVCF